MRAVVSILTPEQEESSFGHSLDRCQVRLRMSFSLSPGIQIIHSSWCCDTVFKGGSCFLPLNKR